MSANISKPFSTDGFTILFNNENKGIAEGLANTIANLDFERLLYEYYKLHYWAPARTQKYFVGHDGEVTSKTTGQRGIKVEDRLSMALWRQSKRNELTWPCQKKGDILLLDYQFPLQPSRNDKKTGPIDLLGRNKRHQFVVIEAKYKGNPETPLDALVQALRYTAIVQANLDVIRQEAREIFNFEEKILDEVPQIQLLATKSWWDSWLQPELGRRATIGEWEEKFTILLADIKEELAIDTVCYALKDLSEEVLDRIKKDTKPEIPRDQDPFYSTVTIGDDKPFGCVD